MIYTIQRPTVVVFKTSPSPGPSHGSRLRLERFLYRVSAVTGRHRILTQAAAAMVVNAALLVAGAGGVEEAVLVADSPRLEPGEMRCGTHTYACQVHTNYNSDIIIIITFI